MRSAPDALVREVLAQCCARLNAAEPATIDAWLAYAAIPRVRAAGAIPSRRRRRAMPSSATATASCIRTAFRRLVYKTQVFLNHEGDLFRTRLTHSLEVAQLGRSIARALRLNEDLVEAIALAHDLGHTPFGHAGQDALNDCMTEHGGFEHNLQSLRVVDELEQRYPQFDGLNLSFETREGILKHCSRANARAHRGARAGRRGAAFLRPHAAGARSAAVQPGRRDRLQRPRHRRRRALGPDQHRAAERGRACSTATAAKRWPSIRTCRAGACCYETIRRMLSAQVYDVIDATRAALEAAAPADADAVRRAGPLVLFSETMRAQSTELKRFLFRNLYRHPQVTADHRAGAAGGARAVRRLPRRAPRRCRPPMPQRADRHRAVADYIAGMTDRFAMREHERLTGTAVDRE